MNFFGNNISFIKTHPIVLPSESELVDPDKIIGTINILFDDFRKDFLVYEILEENSLKIDQGFVRNTNDFILDFDIILVEDTIS